MAAKAEAKKSVKKGDAYKDGQRTKPVCPKCGPGVFMATHGDRVSCGKCGYTEFTKKEYGRKNLHSVSSLSSGDSGSPVHRRVSNLLPFPILLH